MPKIDKYPYCTGMLEALVEHAIRSLRSRHAETRAEAVAYIEDRYAHIARILSGAEEPVL